MPVILMLAAVVALLIALVGIDRDHVAMNLDLHPYIMQSRSGEGTHRTRR